MFKIWEGCRVEFSLLCLKKMCTAFWAKGEIKTGTRNERTDDAEKTNEDKDEEKKNSHGIDSRLEPPRSV